MRESETVAEVKERVQAKLGVAADEFAKWKFSLLSAGGKVEALEDGELLATRFSRVTFGSNETHLGLEHEDKAPKRAAPRGYGHEKAVKIYN